MTESFRSFANPPVNQPINDRRCYEVYAAHRNAYCGQDVEFFSLLWDVKKNAVDGDHVRLSVRL